MSERKELVEQISQLKRLPDSAGPIHLGGFLDNHLPRIQKRVEEDQPTVIEFCGWPASGKSFFRRALTEYLRLRFPEVAQAHKLTQVTFEDDGFYYAREFGQVVTSPWGVRRDEETDVASSYYGQSLREALLSGNLLIIAETVGISAARVEGQLIGLDIGTVATEQLARREGEFRDVGEYGTLLIGAMGGDYLKFITGLYRRWIKHSRNLAEAQEAVKQFWFLGKPMPKTLEDWQSLKLEGASEEQIINIAHRAYETLNKLPDLKNLTKDISRARYSFADQLSLFICLREGLTQDNPYFSEEEMFLGLDKPRRTKIRKYALKRGFIP